MGFCVFGVVLPHSDLRCVGLHGFSHEEVSLSGSLPCSTPTLCEDVVDALQMYHMIFQEFLNTCTYNQCVVFARPIS